MNMELSRRQFVIGASAGVAGTALGALGFGETESAYAAAIRPFKLASLTETRNTCTYCSVACGIIMYSKGNLAKGEKAEITHIEGDTDHPVNRGTLCPKGASSEQLVNNPMRQRTIRYRAPYATEWTDLDLDTAIDMIADRFVESRRRTWQDTDEQGRVLRRTMGIASLGGATLDNEENYLIKKLFTAAGAIQIENQARI